MPMVMPHCVRATLFIPPSLRAQLLERDWGFYGEHWVLPNLALSVPADVRAFLQQYAA